MVRIICFPLIVILLSQCTTPSSKSNIPLRPAAPPVSYGAGPFPHIINVSAYDPKERQRDGRSYSEYDVSALRANGAVGLIARAGKGGVLDTKCANFLAAADRAAMLPGIYYRVQRHVDPVRQADQFVDRAFALARSRSWNAPALLLCGDYDGDLSVSAILRFQDRVYSRTGVIPIAYLENSAQLKRTLSNADPHSKAKLRAAPYWLALYSHDKGAADPDQLLSQYNVWPRWTIWQYGGVAWERGRSRPQVYNHGRWRFPSYFGNMDRPLERNIFNGRPDALFAMWQRHGLRLR